MVKFCPKCGAPLLPKKSDENGLVLICDRCGYETTVASKDLRSYKVRYSIGSNKRLHTSKVSESRKVKISEEDREMLQEYYKVLLESLQEESEEEE